MPNRDLEFLYEVGSLRNMDRGWIQHLGTPCASVLEHTVRVIWIALTITRREQPAHPEPIDENKIIKMALTHDIGETRVSDLSYMQKVYVTADEERAVHDLFDGTVVANYEEIAREYESRLSIEAKIVKDADNLDLDMEMKELEERGHQLPKKWFDNHRQNMRDNKLYTQAAKQLWDEIWASNPADWHMSSNKWIKNPDAGK